MINNDAQDEDRSHTNLQSIVQINEQWVVDQDSPIVGKRDKQMFESPSELDAYLLRHHPYIFKQPKPNRHMETFSEILASYIGGDILDLNIQRSFMAQKQEGGETVYGVLIESFLKQPYYGAGPIPQYGNQTSLLHGGDIIANIYPQYEQRVGEQHSVKLIQRATNSNNRYQIPKNVFVKYWSSLLAFDALINNGDRHHENWAILPHNWKQPSQQPRNELGQYSKSYFKFSPIYDNGGGFASELDPKGLQKLITNCNGNISNAVIRYAARGKAHMGYEEAVANEVTRKTLSFAEIVRKFCTEFPEGHQHALRIAEIDVARVENALDFLRVKAVDFGIEDAEVRLSFIYELICLRKRELLEVLTT